VVLRDLEKQQRPPASGEHKDTWSGASQRARGQRLAAPKARTRARRDALAMSLDELN
jgi:hypothetical protein